MPRDEIEDMLLQDGDFLVRLTELDKAHRLAVSVRWGGRARHILFKLNAAHRWAVRGDADFDSVSKLIAHYVKLGSGSFGDVFLARLDQVDGRPIDVAVKTLKGKMGKQKVPVRYLAPETLRAGTFSTKSDVWAYGIMMWELFTCCKADPYPGMSNSDVKALIGGTTLEERTGTTEDQP
ncbi:Tyrosine-protein kinase [Aphelenchoides fujianensis]|nr:Tyrosine-protein kinase [Aphelenchoides fujianensis]